MIADVPRHNEITDVHILIARIVLWIEDLVLVVAHFRLPQPERLGGGTGGNAAKDHRLAAAQHNAPGRHGRHLVDGSRLKRIGGQPIRELNKGGCGRTGV